MTAKQLHTKFKKLKTPREKVHFIFANWEFFYFDTSFEHCFILRGQMNVPQKDRYVFNINATKEQFIEMLLTELSDFLRAKSND